MNALLKPSEERDLLACAAAGDREARHQLVLANQGLVWKFARRYYNSITGDQTLEDLVQLGNLGLLRAIDRWKPDAGSQCFSTYAVFWIKAYIWREGLMSGSLVHHSYRHFDRTMRARRVRTRLLSRLRREPSTSEVAEETGLEKDFIALVFDLEKNPPVSLDTEYPDASPFYEAIPSGDDTAAAAERKIVIRQLQDAVNTLDEDSYKVIHMRYVDGKNQRSIAREMSVTAQTVRNIERRALAALRRKLLV